LRRFDASARPLSRSTSVDICRPKSTETILNFLKSRRRNMCPVFYHYDLKNKKQYYQDLFFR
jgi:hypothetical protein